MVDLLLKLGGNPVARRLVKNLRLPVPLPVTLPRDDSPWSAVPLHEQRIVVGATENGELGSTIGDCLLASAAHVSYAGDEAGAAAYVEAGRRRDRPVQVGPDLQARADGLVFDASGLDRVEQLSSLHRFFHPCLARLKSGGRIVVVGRTPSSSGAEVERAAIAAALEGFVRSLGREVGRRGATTQLFLVESGAEERLAGPLQFSLTPKSAYVSGQCLHVSSAAVGHAGLIEPQGLSGKTAVVTGAGRGIGAAIARVLAREGCHVIGVDRTEGQAALERVCQEIGGTPVALDVTADDAPQVLVDHVRHYRKQLDVLVHNAGITRDKTLARMQSDAWDRTIDVNLRSILRITPALVETVMADGGRIVAISSVSGIAGNYGQTNYAASKAGVIGYVRALAPRVASRGITVNAVAPGFIESEMTAAMPAATREVARRFNALSQGGRPLDVAEVVSFLALPASLGVNGQVLRVCGLSLVGA